MLNTVSDARTLPASTYVDPHILEAGKEALFFRSWHYVCHAARLAETGQYVTASIFDQDIFVIRGRDGELRVFYNVCPHRGHRLLDGNGSKTRIDRPYHAWTYDLEGQLLRVRGDGPDGGFSQSPICLSTVRIDRMLDFVFINLDPQALPLANYAPGLAESIAEAVPDLSEYEPRDNVDYFGGAYRCKWKVMLDNFLECYHCKVAHPSFADMMDITGNRFTLHDNYSYQYVPTARKEQKAAFCLDLDEDALEGHFWFLFPNTMLSVFTGVKNFSVSRAEPDGPKKTERFLTRSRRPEYRGTARRPVRNGVSKWLTRKTRHCASMCSAACTSAASAKAIISSIRTGRT